MPALIHHSVERAEGGLGVCRFLGLVGILQIGVDIAGVEKIQ